MNKLDVITIRKQVKEAIRFIGTNKKTSGGWVDEVLDLPTDEIVKIITDVAAKEYDRGRADEKLYQANMED